MIRTILFIILASMFIQKHRIDTNNIDSTTQQGCLPLPLQNDQKFATILHRNLWHQQSQYQLSVKESNQNQYSGIWAEEYRKCPVEHEVKTIGIVTSVSGHMSFK